MTLALTAVSALVATLLTHHFTFKKNWAPVRASASVTAAFILLTLPFSFRLIPTLHAACLGGTFVGLSEPGRLSLRQLIAASLVFTGIFHFLIHHLKGFGGALGTSAFAASLLVYLVERLRK